MLSDERGRTPTRLRDTGEDAPIRGPVPTPRGPTIAAKHTSRSPVAARLCAREPLLALYTAPDDDAALAAVLLRGTGTVSSHGRDGHRADR